MAHEYLLYVMPGCPFCHKVLRFMAEKGIELPQADITADPAAREELKRVGGKVQVPCLFIDGEPLYESDGIVAYLEKNLA